MRAAWKVKTAEEGEKRMGKIARAQLPELRHARASACPGFLFARLFDH
jgi:hypothetical protein